jgi:hypothetical protein
MNNGVISLSDYANSPSGWGQLSSSALGDLVKAITTSDEGVVAAGEGGGAKLRMQSLETTMTSLTFELEELTMYNMMPKQPAYSTTEEYDRKIRHGAKEFGDGFISEIDTPYESDQLYSREVATVKFLGVKKRTSIISTLVKNIADPMEEQTQEAAIDLATLCDGNMMWGNDSVNPLAWKGLHQQVYSWVGAHSEDAEIIIDCKGSPITEDILDEAALRTRKRFGRLTDIIMAPTAITDISKQFLPKERYQSRDNDGVFGNDLTGYRTPNGKVKFKEWVFLENNRGLKPRTQAMPNAPAAADAATVAAANLATSELKTGTTYYYWVAMLKDGRESAAFAAGNATTDAVNKQKITITVADAKFTPAGQSYATDAMRVYRNTVNDSATASWLADVPRKKSYNADCTLSDNAASVYVDVNQNMENTTVAFGIENNKRVWEFRKFAPVMKMDLAIVETAYPFMTLMFGVPILKNPRRAILFKNVGRLS